MTENNEDDYLLASIRRGDRNALTSLFRKYYRHLFRMALCLTKDSDIAYEIVIDVFTMLWKNREILNDSQSVSYHLFSSTRKKATEYAENK